MCEQRGIPYTILRPCIIYGRYNYAPRESYFFDRISNDEPMIVPQNRLALFSFVWVADVARIILRCIDNADVFNQTFNAAAPELISYRRLVEVLETISGKWLPVEEMSVEDINAGGIPLPFPLDSHLIYSGAAIQRKLGFEYTSFVTGMGDTYEHYRFLQEQKESARAKSSV
jgi:nucleoside-diphosphate-sugar epimerase